MYGATLGGDLEVRVADAIHSVHRPQVFGDDVEDARERRDTDEKVDRQHDGGDDEKVTRETHGLRQ